jgi:hypothetical protein
VLRRQAIVEFPDATMAVASERWRERLAGAGDWIRNRRGARAGGDAKTSAPGPADEVRLDRLERLARLREAGVLDDDELRAEKARILGS